ncbi:hypothetical protein AMTR_s00050p00132660 [Amborella trichopoda]|uniref:Uncharacterized protein n=1 Tax=Amborella trichopoda TaxID=13333 RepID=W1PXC9_AMBTC|nr:hypothetical protein AMTR_s00050p00132660 [Amborella trichopoda]
MADDRKRAREAAKKKKEESSRGEATVEEEEEIKRWAAGGSWRLMTIAKGGATEMERGWQLKLQLAEVMGERRERGRRKGG